MLTLVVGSPNTCDEIVLAGPRVVSPGPSRTLGPHVTDPLAQALSRVGANLTSGLPKPNPEWTINVPSFPRQRARSGMVGSLRGKADAPASHDGATRSKEDIKRLRYC